MTPDLKHLLIYSLVGLILALCLVIVLLTAYVVFLVVNRLEAREANQTEQQVFVPVAPKLSLWQQIDRRFLTGAVELEREEEILLRHEYDGIRELDNHLPPWWTSLFYGSIAFSVIYLLIFHVWSSAPLQEGEYLAEQEQAKIEIAAYQAKSANAIDETNVTLVDKPEALAEGKTLYDMNCRACHGGKGEGGVGPNLTDEFWLHGGDVKAVFKTVKDGVPEKGMISWKAKFKPAEIRSVSSYILTLQGTNPPNGKAPQGDRVQASGKPDTASL